MKIAKTLIIGNYPPPMCGWAIQTKLAVEELRRRGHCCDVLKINEGRQTPSEEYVDVQSGFDYVRKVWRYARGGYALNAHLNGMGRTGYFLALAAAVVGKLANSPVLLTFHGGLPQNNFPRESGAWRFGFELLFRLADGIACDDLPMKEAIEAYGVPPENVYAIPAFSPQYLDFKPASLSREVEEFFESHGPVILSYVSFRPEYRLDVLRVAMRLFRKSHPEAGFIWLGFPAKEYEAAKRSLETWPDEERKGLFLLGNLPHDEFLTLLSRSSIFLRTPVCDGVCASVLEALALGIPVVASENQRRPASVLTYPDGDAPELCKKLLDVVEHRVTPKASLRIEQSADNIAAMADWLSGQSAVGVAIQVAPVGSN